MSDGTGKKFIRVYRDADGKIQQEETSETILESSIPVEEDFGLATPEQRAAIKFGADNIFPIEILSEVAASIPPSAPNGSEKPGWVHGACRRVWTIGGYDVWAIENGTAPKDIDLSDIQYVGFYRQAVKNKYTGEVKGFATTVPLTFAGEVTPGQTIELKKEGQPIRPGWKREEVESMARESFLKLQEMCEEFYNREEK